MRRGGYLLVLGLILVLAGCNRSGIGQLFGQIVSQNVLQQKSQPLERTDSEKDADAAQKSGVWMPQEPEAQSPQKSSGTEVCEYAYETLNLEAQRQLYREILCSLEELQEQTELSTLDEAAVRTIFDCVMADHPEIFYVDGYSTQVYKLGSSVKKITFTGTYTQDTSNIEELRGKILETADRWMAGMDRSWDDYKKVKYLYETLIANTEYDIEAADSQNILSVFLNGRSVCQGYAKAFQFLCRQAGISSVLVSGSVNGVGHAWTLAKLDGEWYHVDPTWGDAAWQLDGELDQLSSALPDMNYDYFCVTAEAISSTHCTASAFALPECTAVTDQYYRREGLYLESADMEQVASILNKAAAAGKNYVTFQCSNDQVYEEVYCLLIEKQRIFELLPTDRISYADSAGQRTITFWLTE